MKLLLVIVVLASIAVVVFIIMNAYPKACPKCKRMMVEEFIDGKWFYMCKDCGHVELKKKIL